MKAPWRKIAILGGTGRMGRWFASQFKELGLEVYILSRRREKAVKTAGELGVEAASLKDLSKFDLLLLSTPIAETPRLVLEAAGKLAEGATLTEICSVKANVVKALEEAVKRFKVKAVSLHPLFGPGAAGFKGQRVAVIPVKDCLETAEAMADFLKSVGAKVVWVESAARHDAMVAFTLALPHFINIVFGLTLAGKPIRQLNNYAGTTFKLQKTLCESVLQEDPETYASIQIYNPYFRRLLRILRSEMERLGKAVESRDTDKFKRIFMRAVRSLKADPEFAEAYRRFYRALEVLD